MSNNNVATLRQLARSSGIFLHVRGAGFLLSVRVWATLGVWYFYNRHSLKLMAKFGCYIQSADVTCSP
eukprot:8092678-Pyramimonas_sp.AAC.1